MPGMNSGLSPASTILANAFRSAFGHQLVIIALIFLVLLIAWAATRAAIFGGPAVGKRGAVTLSLAALGGATARGWREPPACRFLRAFFGLLWVFDGLLQAQPQMAGGLADQVIKPTEAGSPGWVVSLMNYGVNLWDYHPVTAAASAVWIQVGIGLWMCFAARGLSSRLAAASSIAWGLIVWGFGEAFGGIFAPQLTLLYGAPGGALLYVVAGAFLAAVRPDLGAADGGAGAARTQRGLLPRHGAAAGLAVQRVLAGEERRAAGEPAVHDRFDGNDVSAAFP